MTQADRQGLESHDEGRVDAENPWPGLESFREQDQEFFRGRETETESLERLVLRDRLTVVFGKSGLGKTSLLRAGLFPRLRNRHILPIYIRLDYSEPEPDLRNQVLEAVMHAAEEAGVEAPAADAGRSLWEYFHRRNADFWNDRNQLVTPLLVFDQFEEIFTLGQSTPARALATRNLVGELADLVEGHPPAELRTELDAAPEKARAFSYKRHGYKVLLSLREDFLPDLEELRDEIPSVIHNRLRLQHMSADAAMQVVTQVPELISDDVAQRVVRFVAAAEDGDGEVPLAEMEIEPAQLCVVCRELNNKRRARQEPMITADLLKGTRDQILVDLYEQSVEDLAPEVRELIEDRLLTVSGFRDSLAYDNALETPGVTRDHIDKLVDRRLLRAEERDGVRRIELTHDLLTGVIGESRNARRRRKEAKARQQETVKRLRARHARRVKRLVVSLNALFGVLALALIILLLVYREKDRVEEKNAVLEAQRACSEGDEDKCNYLAEVGGSEKTRRLSPFFLSLRCKLGSADACAKLGALYESGEAGVLNAKRASSLYVKAAEVYKRRCDEGHAESCGGLAALYDKGRGVKQDDALAAELHRKACDDDVARSCGGLGVLTQWGRGLSRDDTRAAELFAQACQGGSPDGCYNLGLLYRWGSNVKKNTKRAAEFYEIGCDGGNGDACARLGRLYWRGTGVKQDRKEGARFYKDACRKGSAWGCRQIGYAYEEGRGVDERDPGRMVAFYARGCEQGAASACYQLGRHQEGGNRTKSDPKAAIYAAALYQRACDRGSGAGCAKLGRLFRKGRAVVRDEERAAGLFQQACSRGNPQSCELIRITGEASRLGSMTQDEILAVGRDCQDEDPRACVQLGRHYENLDEFAEAERRYASAVLLGTASNANKAWYADSLYALTTFYMRTGQYENADAWRLLHRDIVTKLQEADGDDSLVYARSVNDLAELYVSRDVYSKAKSLYRVAIRIQQAAISESALRKDDPSYVNSLTGLALLYALGDYDKAEETYESAQQALAAAVGEEHPSYANLLAMRALLRERTGRLASAAMLLEGSLSIWQAAFGGGDLLSASNLIDLGLLYEKAGRDSEAERLYQSALTITKVTAGRGSSYYTTSVNNLANLYMRIGRLEQAESLLHQEKLWPSVECTDRGPWTACNDDLLYKATLATLGRLKRLSGHTDGLQDN